MTRPQSGKSYATPLWYNAMYKPVDCDGCVARLAFAVDGYLEWMVAKGYSARTIEFYQIILRQFQAFVAQLPTNCPG